MPNITIPKFEERAYSEDVSLCDSRRIAVSDGAGGCGIFAERWSAYLLEKLPAKKFVDFVDFSVWLDSIWEDFFESTKSLAASVGGFAQNKFYDEGSYATFAAAWKYRYKVYWVAYGDTVVFHYDKSTKQLQHSFTALNDFAESPFLINWKNELDSKGFVQGEYKIAANSVVFVASDALAFYILAMYLIFSKPQGSEIQIENVLKTSSLQKNLLEQMMLSKIETSDFETAVLTPLFQAAYSQDSFKSYINQLYQKGQIQNDDYSLAWMDFSISK